MMNKPIPSKPNRGRPRASGQDARQALLVAARQCFTQHPYPAVTTRMLAEHANVNASLIRYYFINKKGLYQHMLADVAKTFRDGIQQHLDTTDENPFSSLLTAYQRLVTEMPALPQLIFRELVFNQGQGRQVVIDNVIKPNAGFLLGLLQKYQQQHAITADVPAPHILLSTMSLAVMPILMKDVFEQFNHQPLDNRLLTELYQLYAQLLSDYFIHE
ncbi:TetR/AcrR family transcriptional regulator [Aestuariibacter halophilus]|uniref:TetR/AcrR family transcriptional regulator n=1 Tax=Fluctibacter halophilus TaxID=226011 RepID=A0ABS8G906_9ALTE|nr:TetR/AcrR family transcriptional regulator [Aestuariibacter halophilus]MCC2617062.1 TetR/AcrR family transcriptional regulator [Aestuariibacter halophilus]